MSGFRVFQGYKWREERVEYKGLKQPWLIVESETRKESYLKKLEQQIKREKEQAIKKVKELEKEEFAEISKEQLSK